MSGSTVISAADAERLTLLSDVTGSPAVAGILEQHVSDLPVQVHVDVPQKENTQSIAKDGAEVTWHVRPEHVVANLRHSARAGFR